MDRRRLLLLGPAAAVAGCRTDTPTDRVRNTASHQWKMVTTWPAQFPIFGTAAERLARRIEAASDGQIRIQVFGGGELVPPFEVFDAVSRGVAEIGHGTPAYWRGQVPAAQLFTGFPFGMTASQLNAWLYFGGGLALWREAYAPYSLIPFPAGNTGTQMGGWYHRPIRSLEDFRGLKIRIAGLGAEVLERIGATPVVIPGAELFTALQTGAIDATEFTGPANDMAFGLHQVARFYHYPGWHEPSGMVECLVNAGAFEALSDALKAVVEEVCAAENDRCAAEFTARNQRALAEIEALPDIELVPFTGETLIGLREAAGEVLAEIAAGDALFGRVLESLSAFRAESARWQSITERVFLDYQLG